MSICGKGIVPPMSGLNSLNTRNITFMLDKMVVIKDILSIGAFVSFDVRGRAEGSAFKPAFSCCLYYQQLKLCKDFFQLQA